MTKFLPILFFCLLSLGFKARAQMEFVENKGQWDQRVLFKGDFNTGSFFLESQGFTVLMHHPDDLNTLSEKTHGHGAGGPLDPSFKLRSFAYKVKFMGANPQPLRIPEKPFPTYNNYFLGDDPGRWATDCKLFQAITYKEMYPGIDLRYYSEGNALKYDFIVHPGADPSRIVLLYDGPELKVKQKELNVITPVGTVRELHPYSYQMIDGVQTEVTASYVVRKNMVSFKLPSYRKDATLIIDPAVIFSTFTGSRADNWGYTATPGPDGSFFSGGIVFATSGAGFPVSPGAFQTGYGGGVPEDGLLGYDISIFKFSANGRNRLYATYLGGAANEQPHSMIVDAEGNLVVAGRTSSSNFPKTTALVGPGGGTDIFITRFNAAGNGLLGSVVIGGRNNDGVNIRSKYSGNTGQDALRLNYGDDARSEVILDNAGNIILASCTQSQDFPVVAPLQASFAGGRQDGVILKFPPNLSAPLFSTYFGGSGDDACFVTSVHPTNGLIYVAGGTTSNNLPGDKTNVLQPAYQGGSTDGFVTIVTPNGSNIIKTTYQGTGGTDIVYGLKFDKFGFPYIMGTTTGTWPVINAAFRNNGGKQFISKLNEDLSSYVYSTVFGTNSADPNISPIAFLVDRCENVYVSGWGGGINNGQNYNTGTTANLPSVQPLPNIPAPDGSDFYFFVLERNATRQLFGSHYGQFNGTGDHVDGGTSRFDENGVIYQAMCANCSGNAAFPTTPGVWAATNGSSNCNLAAVKIEMNFAGVGSSLQTSINAVVGANRGCIPLEVQFTDTLQQGVKFYWDFGDGTRDTTTSFQNTHLFTNIGTYTVRLISEDSTTCNIRDTAFAVIRAGDNAAELSFNFEKLPPCENLTVRFTNTSIAGRGSFGPRAFVWDYGDGSPLDTVNFNPPRLHTYAAPGTYIVKLYVIDTTFCNAPFFIEQRVSLFPLVEAAFTTEPTGCVPYTAVFNNESLAGTRFIWDFGDGTTSEDFEPTKLYSNVGTYNVRLIAIDSSTCNIADTANFTIRVLDNPTAAIASWGPNPPRENTPVRFTNGSQNAIRYVWNFGDGESSTQVNPTHQYNASGTYTAELIAFNAAGCSDTATVEVNVIVVPVLDVPNAFTPGKFGENSTITVRGFGIGKMDWRIYNRWGQVVFQTNNRNAGWDGTFKGKLQPMDVYTFTLDVQFTDGTTLRRTGDITLLR